MYLKTDHGLEVVHTWSTKETPETITIRTAHQSITLSGLQFTELAHYLIGTNMASVLLRVH